MSEDQPTFQIEKIYVKDLSLEIPNAPQVFLQNEQPQLEVQIDNGSEQFAEGAFEVTVSVTVTARVGERTIFLAEAVQAGIFSIRGVPEADLEPLLTVTDLDARFIPRVRRALDFETREEPLVAVDLLGAPMTRFDDQLVG